MAPMPISLDDAARQLQEIAALAGIFCVQCERHPYQFALGANAHPVEITIVKRGRGDVETEAVLAASRRFMFGDTLATRVFSQSMAELAKNPHWLKGIVAVLDTGYSFAR